MRLQPIPLYPSIHSRGLAKKLCKSLLVAGPGPPGLPEGSNATGASSSAGVLEIVNCERSATGGAQNPDAFCLVVPCILVAMGPLTHVRASIGCAAMFDAVPETSSSIVKGLHRLSGSIHGEASDRWWAFFLSVSAQDYLAGGACAPEVGLFTSCPGRDHRA